jgi:hypothetical protein
VKNPLRSEAEAFQFLLGAAVYFGLIAIAGVINAWAGLVMFIVLTSAVLIWWLRARRHEVPKKEAPRSRSGPDERRILVVANETVGGSALLEQIRNRSEGVNEHVLVVVPALNSPLKHWTSDEDGAREAAQERLEASLRAMRAAGIDARGEVGDSDPLQAIEDALRTFAPDELIISTHPPERSHWLERGVVVGARERFALPVTHVVVDLAQPAAG